MTERKLFEMTQVQFDKLLESMQPVRLIALQCGMPSSQQENANRAWDTLGDEMGFDGSTVEPSDKGKLFFTAIPKEIKTCQ